MDSFLETGVVPSSLAGAPKRVPMAQARSSMSLADRVALGRAPRSGFHRPRRMPLTVIEQRGLEAALKLRRDSRPPIFTAEFVEAQGAAAIAQLLDDCYYDLARAERR